MTTFSQYSGTRGANDLSIALIGPDEHRRKLVFSALAGSHENAVQEYPFYPDLDDVSGLMEQNFDVVMVDLDSDSEYALSLVTSIGRAGSTIVMVYSGQADSRLMMRCMRAGAREFLTVPVTVETMEEALSQVGGRQPKEAPVAYQEPAVPAVEVRSYEPTPAPEVRSYEPEPRVAATPEIRPRGLYPNYDPGTRGRAPEVNVLRAELRPYEPVAGLPTPGSRTPTPEPLPYAPEPRSYEPAAGLAASATRTPAPEPAPYLPEPRLPEPRPYEPVGGIPSTRVRSANLEPRPYGQESRPYEPAAGITNPAARPSAPEQRSYEPVAGIAAPASRQPLQEISRPSLTESRYGSPEPRSYEPAAGVVGSAVRPPAPEVRIAAVSEGRTFGATESRSYEPAAPVTPVAPRIPAPESRPYEPISGSGSIAARGASSAESRSFGSPESRSYESGAATAAAAAVPATRSLTPGLRPTSRGSRLPNHGPRFSNPEVRATNPEVRSASPEVRVAAPEVRVAAVPEVRPPAPDARPLTTEVRPPAPEARPAITEARTPAAAPDSRAGKKTGGKVLVFLGAKGGSGTTSIACNFSSALARESGKKTLLIDLHLPLGNVALELGVKPQYSIVDALRNAARLDSNFLSKLLSKHRSGLFVLASPDKFTPIQVSKDAIEKLLTTARQDFDYIVVDLGARLDLSELTGTAMLEDSATVYLITQDNVAELRNSNRLITEYFSDNGPKLEIVLNRYTPRISGIGMYSSHLVDEKHIGAALTKSPDWRIPQDSSDILLPVEGSSVARLFQNMARTVCEMEIIPESKKRTDGKEHSVSLFQ